MAIVDEVFKNMCKDIIENGTDTKGQDVRPIWEDTGEKAYTVMKSNVVNIYDLRKEFPISTFRRNAFKDPIREVLWIFQKKSNNINDLGLHIWDQWADENGSIGKAYGYQIAQKYRHHKDSNGNWVELDQMDAVLYDLKHTPFSRRIMTNIYNINDLADMRLQPCCWALTFNVTDEGKDKLVLNAVLNQRSNDLLAAGNWNVVQYSALLMMIAQSVNMEAGVLTHCIANAHIYDRHMPLVKELIERESFPAPIVTLDPSITDFYDFTPDSFTITDYRFGEPIKNIPIAI